jgi:hypothetical protein
MRNEVTIACQVNTYRVLLTPARYEIVIWVPRGGDAGRTREQVALDAIARLLADCGTHELEATTMPETPMPQARTAQAGSPP